MKSTPLYICDRDSVYLDKLSGYIMGKPHSPFIVRGMTEYDESLIRNLSEGIVLISSDLLREKTSALDVRRTIILISTEINKNLEEFNTIYKYQSAGAIYQRLLQYQMNREDIYVPENAVGVCKSVKVIGMFSPIHRIGKTSLLKELCARAGQEEKVLLISLEEYSKEDEDGEGLSELIYYYKQGKLIYSYCLDHFIRREETYDYIRPVRLGKDLWDMSAQDWADMIKIIKNWGVYDSIWIDFDGLSNYEILLSACEKIYVPYIPDTKEYRRIQRFEAALELAEDEKIKEKIVKINMESRSQIYEIL